MGAADTANPAPPPQAADVFTPASAAPPHAVQDDLAQARRAPRAAAEQAANTANASGAGLGAGRDEGERSRFSTALKIVAVVLLGVLALAGAALMLHNWVPGSDVTALEP